LVDTEFENRCGRVKLGVDLTRFDTSYSGGVSTFALGLTHGLISAIPRSDRVVLLATSRNSKDLARRFGADDVSVVEVEEAGHHRYMLSLLGYLGFMFRTFKLPYCYNRLFRSNVAARIESAIDVLIAPMTTLSLPSGRVPSILCVHDIQHEYHPEYFSFRERASRWGAYRLSCWAASAVQSSSQFVKDCLLEKFQFLSSDKIFVAPEGVDFAAFDPTASMEPPPAEVDTPPGSFLFYPAQLWPHKNHVLLVEALTAFRNKNGYELPCLLTGQDCGMLQTIMDAVGRARLSKVRYLGKVPFTQLLWLYSNCKAVLALGLHESSSLPLREGAVFGKPLICSDIPPNEELARELYVLPFVSRNPRDLSARFDALISSEPELTEKSMQNRSKVRRFNWKAIAKQYLVIANDLDVSARQGAQTAGTA
jgi:glycosyltransferase involved in cell wall biosynthesis